MPSTERVTTTQSEHRFLERLAFDGAEHRAVAAALKRGRVLGKGATVKQQLTLAKLAPEAVVRVRHDRPLDTLTFFAGKMGEHSKTVISPNGGATTVAIYPNGDVDDRDNYILGHALCHEHDNYRKQLGVHIALARALDRLEAKCAADEGGWP